MTEPTPAQIDPRKVRAGLVLVTLIVLVAAVLVVVIDDALGRSVMFAVALLGVVRAYLLSRSLRRG
jgi:hypothetical protein